MNGGRHRASRVAMLAALLSALCPPSTMAQAPELQGETVRVLLTSDQQIEGVVLSWNESLLELRSDDGATVQVGWGEVQELALYRTRRNTWRGLWIGAVVGGVVAGTSAGVTWEPCTAICFGPEDRGGTIALAALLGASAGGLVGMVAGALITSPSWEPIVVPSASGSPAADGSTVFRVGVRWFPR